MVVVCARCLKLCVVYCFCVLRVVFVFAASRCTLLVVVFVVVCVGVFVVCC